MHYLTFFAYIFAILFPILSILFSWRIGSHVVWKYILSYSVILMLPILMELNWMNLEWFNNLTLLLLTLSFVPIFFNHIKKKFAYWWLILVYVVSFSFFWLFSILDFISEKRIILSNKTILVYTETTGWAWINADTTTIIGKHKWLLLEKEFYRKTFQDVIVGSTEKINTWLVINLITSTWQLLHIQFPLELAR